jgi:hypothetical protein
VGERPHRPYLQTAYSQTLAESQLVPSGTLPLYRRHGECTFTSHLPAALDCLQLVLIVSADLSTHLNAISDTVPPERNYLEQVHQCLPHLR